LGSRLNTGDPARERRAFLLALAAMAVVVIVDLGVDTYALLIQLLLVGPLIAATGATVRQTWLVAILAVAVSVPLVAGTDAFGSGRYFVATAVLILGGTMSVIIARLRAQRERDAARLAAQYGVARAIAGAAGFDESAPRLLAAIARPLGRQVAQFWSMDPEAGVLRCAVHWREDGVGVPDFERASREREIRRGEELPGLAWELMRPVWLRDAVAAGTFARGREAEHAGLHGGVAFPVTHGDECLGVIELFSHEVRERDPETYAFTDVLGRQIGEFIERHRAEQEREEARLQVEAILRGVADAVTAQAPDGRLLFANDAAVAMLGYESSEALLAASTTDILNRFEMMDEHGAPFPLEELRGRRALERGESAEALMRFRVRETGEERWSAVKSTPIRDADGGVAMAINVIEDLTAHKRAELAQRFLAQSSSVLGSSLDPDELLREVAALTVPEVADWCAVDLRGTNGAIDRVAIAHADPGMVAHLREMAKRYPPKPGAPRGVPHVLRTGSPEVYEEIPDVLLREAAVDAEHHRLLSDLQVRSAMVVPMIARGRTIGALSLATGPSGRRFDPEDLELAEELARRCASAVDNARLYRERAYIARTLQESLLPIELPEIPGIEAAARFLPTGEGSEVGGDFYDVFETGGCGWTVVIGDVCGKGPDAAAVTALARYTLRAAAMGQSVPSRSLNMLNEALLRQRDDRRFCTVAYAYLEVLDGGARVGIASGGHPLPLLIHPDGKVEPLGEHGTLLGVVPDPQLEDRAVSLAPGDAIVFYTDGVVETRGGPDVLDEAGLAGLVSACAGRGADAIAATVEEAALRSQGGRPRDDIAVLVLRMAG
jgi:PAS domain S-box-containing protein